MRPTQLYLAQRLARLLDEAQGEAEKMRDEYISTEHLFIAILDDQGAAGRLLRQNQLNRDKTRRRLPVSG